MKRWKWPAVGVVVGFGVAAGIAVAVVLQQSGSTAGDATDDPCFGYGVLERTVVSEPTEGAEPKVVNICRKLGSRVVIDASGTPEYEDILDQEVADYYRANPDKNPRLIAEQTADADFAQNGFEKVDLPPVPTDPTACADGWQRVQYPRTGISLCEPPGWKLKKEDEAGVMIEASDGHAQLSVFVTALKETLGTKCAEPARTDLPNGTVLVCAMKPNDVGGQGIGLKLPSGREGGINFFGKISEVERVETFVSLYSVLEQ